MPERDIRGCGANSLYACASAHSARSPHERRRWVLSHAVKANDMR